MNQPTDRFDIESWLVLADWYEEKKWDCPATIIRDVIVKWIQWVQERKLDPYISKGDVKEKYWWQNNELNYQLEPKKSIPDRIFKYLMEYKKLPYDKFYSSEELAWDDLLLAWIEYEANKIDSK